MYQSTGARQLEKWIGDGNATQTDVAKALDVTRQAVSSWCCGRVQPSLYYALAIQRMTDGVIPVDAWLTEERAASLASLTPLRYKPAETVEVFS